jgi:hypothetical protein
MAPSEIPRHRSHGIGGISLSQEYLPTEAKYREFWTSGNVPDTSNRGYFSVISLRYHIALRPVFASSPRVMSLWLFSPFPSGALILEPLALFLQRLLQSLSKVEANLYRVTPTPRAACKCNTNDVILTSQLIMEA